ncbi:MAG: hypothetical protein FJ315_09395 [SAR202 cluster bacterium]|nr:hypothetical protein [SAR202 cluster bacterium]
MLGLEKVGDLNGTPPGIGTGEADDQESDGTTTDGEGSGTAETHRQRAERLRLQRGHRRLRSYLRRSGGVTGWANMLESMAVTPATSRMYQEELDCFRATAEKEKWSLVTDEDIDGHLVDHMNSLYFTGHQAWRGEKLLAGFVHFFPEFGRLGKRSIARAWKALKAWRRLTPGRSRRPVALAIWCGIAVFLAEQVRVLMAVAIMLALSAYLRPSELLRLTGESLVAPSSACPHWCLLLHPSEGSARSKTRTADDSIILDSAYTAWMSPVFEVLKKERRQQRLFSFDYPSLLAGIKRATAYWKCGAIVPYQWRHSGPSIDRALKLRSLDEVQKRGRWQSSKSVARYEKGARLGVMWNELDEETKERFMFCERHLGELVLGDPTFGKVTVQ